MIRVLWFSLLIPILLVILWDDAPSWVIQAAFVGSLAAIVFGLFTNRLALKCPHCHKRVKLGASTCHHCGAQVTTPRAIGAPRHDPMTVVKECEACKSPIRPDATVCPQCRTPQAEVWTLTNGIWWDKDVTGAPVWYDQGSRQWMKAS